MKTYHCLNWGNSCGCCIDTILQ